MPRILITAQVLWQQHGPWREVLEKNGFEVVFTPTPEQITDTKELSKFLEGISAVLASTDPYTPEVLRNAKDLRCVARAGVGYDTIDLPAATAAKIAVTITPGTNEISVAEQALSLLLGVFRGQPTRDAEMRRGRWHREILPRLCGKTIGLVGLGRIGKAMVPRCQGLGLKVLAYDPYPNPAYAAEHNVRLVSLPELLRESDIVSLHTPCTAENTRMINRETLAQMRPGSVLINTSRGGLVDEDALCDAIASGHLFGAGLDVFQVEPLPPTSRLLTLPHVLLCSHMGGLDHESLEAMSRVAAECAVNLHQGRWPEGCVVNEEIRPGWKW